MGDGKTKNSASSNSGGSGRNKGKVFNKHGGQNRQQHQEHEHKPVPDVWYEKILDKDSERNGDGGDMAEAFRPTFFMYSKEVGPSAGARNWKQHQKQMNNESNSYETRTNETHVCGRTIGAESCGVKKWRSLKYWELGALLGWPREFVN